MTRANEPIVWHFESLNSNPKVFKWWKPHGDSENDGSIV